MKIFESEKTLAFLDIGPLSKGHSVRRAPLKLLPVPC
jgi:diadenosine tetraphosphate (Ap4A) HIT family hydrolase